MYSWLLDTLGLVCFLSAPQPRTLIPCQERLSPFLGSIRCLALGLPTASRIGQSYALLFHEGGVCQFTDPGRSYLLLGEFGLLSIRPLEHSALTDPSSLLKRCLPVSHVSSGSRNSYFYMEGWSFSEIPHAYVGRPHGRSHYPQSFVLESPSPLQ